MSEQPSTSPAGAAVSAPPTSNPASALHADLQQLLCNMATILAAHRPPPSATATASSDGSAHDGDVDDLVVDAFIDLCVETRRAALVEYLRGKAESLIKPHVTFSQALTFAVFRKTVNSLLPSWILTAANFQWKRQEAPPALVKETETAAAKHFRTLAGAEQSLPTRHWVAPLYDAGELVVLAPGTEIDQLPAPAVNLLRSSGGDAASMRLRAWTAKTASDETALVEIGRAPQQHGAAAAAASTAANVATFPLASLRLAKPKPFCRDALLPAGEDEPAGRCGSSAVFSRLVAALKLPQPTAQRIVVELASAATAARLELWALRRELCRIAVAAATTTTEQPRSSSSAALCYQQLWLTTTPRAAESSSGLGQEVASLVAPTLQQQQQQPASDDVVFALRILGQDVVHVTGYHLLKLLLLHERRAGRAAASSPGRSSISAIVVDELVKKERSWQEIAQRYVSAGHQQLAPEERRGRLIFLLRVATVMTRYLTLDGGPSSASYSNMHAAIHPRFAVRLQQQPATPSSASSSMMMPVTRECFANPFNTSTLEFGSLFADTDWCFGSGGAFFDLDFQQQFAESGATSLCFEVNPPFEQNTIARMSAKLLAALEQAAKDEHRRCLSFVIVLPRPAITTAEGQKMLNAYNQLLQSRFCIAHELLAASDAAFLRGVQQHTAAGGAGGGSAVNLSTITLREETSVMLLSSSAQQDVPATLRHDFAAVVNEWRAASRRAGVTRAREDD